MLNRKSTFHSSLNNKGQVALFVALIFQILFLFFAMVINVGLLVHHKINLQNSVDLAAYYGAMKQAENMNAIGHVNYQIRQSWKLLAWRYRMLGTAGEWYNHPFNKQTKRIDRNGEDADILSNIADLKNLQEAPAFCITYIPFKPMPKGENTCRDMSKNSGVKLFDIPPVIAGHQAYSKVISNATRMMQNAALERCKYFGAYNYVMLGKFIVAYNIDQGERMDLISALSRATSYAKDDFYDIDGQKASTGIKNTLTNNLTAANRESMGESNVKIFNSLGADGCNTAGTASGQPAKWLNPIRIYPGFAYTDTSCRQDNRSGYISTFGKELTGSADSRPLHINDAPELRPEILELEKYVGFRSNLNDNYNFSIGVEKNPWCMAYVGVSAETAPKIPFSPFGAVKLKARAFYKPFGGRIGPWYQSRWAPGSERSSGGEKMDPLVPPRVTDLSALGGMNDAANKALRASNFSRYVGDTLGLKSLRMMSHYARAIYQLDPKWKTQDSGSAESSHDAYVGDDAPNFAHWDHLPFSFASSSDAGDILAWDGKKNAPSKMRELEIAGIAPDLFDMTYYSIEPDYYHNYYLRIRDGYLKGPGRDFNRVIRPDIGYHKGFKSGPMDLEKFTIRDQIAILKQSDLNLPINDKFTFLTTSWQNVLTSWAPQNLMDYSLNTKWFGKCLAEPLGSKDNSPNPPTSGNCVVGGSTGFSVKMISSSYLRSQDLVLGGESAGSGPLKNPPPDDDDF